MEIKYIESAARVLNRDCVNKRGLDLSKNVLCVTIENRQSPFYIVNRVTLVGKKYIKNPASPLN